MGGVASGWLAMSRCGNLLYIFTTHVNKHEKMGYMRRDIMWLRISLCDVLHSASRVHVVYSCVFVYEYSLMLES